MEPSSTPNTAVPLTIQPSVNSRIVVVEQIYFQSSDGMPVPNEIRFSRQLKTDEQPYQRRIKVGKEWQPLDCGWIDKCGMLSIEHEPPNWQVNPTVEERKKVMERVVEIITNRPENSTRPNWLIPIGESFRGMPGKLLHIFLRCPTANDVRVKITLYPN